MWVTAHFFLDYEYYSIFSLANKSFKNVVKVQSIVILFVLEMVNTHMHLDSSKNHWLSDLKMTRIIQKLGQVFDDR